MLEPKINFQITAHGMFMQRSSLIGRFSDKVRTD